VSARIVSKEERQLAFLWLAAAASALVLRPVWLALTPHLRSCVFRSLTGIPCPTCGTTRAATALLDGNVFGAVAANPLAAAAGVIFVVGAPIAVLWTLARWPVPELPAPLPRWTRCAILALILANWAYVVAVG
jgi:hypothetical protein